MRVMTGGGHCSAIRYEFVWPLSSPEVPVRACSCGFCTKHRGTYTSHPEAKLEAVVDDSLVSAYTFATGTADFLICSRCGVVPFATSVIDGRLYAVVNVNTFDKDDVLILTESISDFEGETVDERLARRARTWISRVSIDHRADRAR